MISGIYLVLALGAKRYIDCLKQIKTKKLERRTRWFYFSILNIIIKVIHIHETQFNMSISVYKLLRHPWII